MKIGIMLKDNSYDCLDLSDNCAIASSLGSNGYNITLNLNVYVEEEKSALDWEKLEEYDADIIESFNIRFSNGNIICLNNVSSFVFEKEYMENRIVYSLSIDGKCA